MSKILVTGRNGQLASDLVSYLKRDLFDVIALSKDELDISNSTEVSKVILTLGVNWVINCAAITNLDYAELDEAKAYEVNSKGAENIAMSCHNARAGMVHISTDAVFSSDKPHYFKVESPCNPRSKYGFSKMKGEEAIRGALDKHWILRSSWIYGLRGSRFFNSILSKAISSKGIRVVEDQFGQPTSTLMMYETIHRIISGELETGTHHVVPVRYVSRFEFSLAINKAYKEVFNTDGGSQIDPILTHQTVGVAPRSPYSLLQPSQSALGINSLNSDLVDEIIRIIKLRKAGTL